jgi:hypothetical protein
MGLFGRKKKVDAASLGGVESSLATAPREAPPPNQAIELGTIHYVNLTPDGRHGDLETALRVAAEPGKPIFANFVEWSG